MNKITITFTNGHERVITGVTSVEDNGEDFCVYFRPE